MSSNLSINGTQNSVLPATETNHTAMQLKPDSHLESEVLSIQTTDELRKAELQGKPVSLSEEQVIKAIEKANKALQGINTSFEFSIHDKTHEIMVKVLNKDTGELIREIPSEKTLDMVARLWELSGIIVDKKI